MQSEYWRHVDNQKSFLGWLATKLDIQQQEDWHKVPPWRITNSGGKELLELYKGNIVKALRTAYPEVQWTEPKTAFWENRTNQREFMEWLGKELCFKKPADWYSLSGTTVRERGGDTLLCGTFRGSVISAVHSIFPEYELHQLWRFGYVPSSYWDSLENKLAYLRWASDKLGINNLDEWKAVKIQQVHQLNGKGLLARSNGLRPLLELCFPKHSWETPRGDGNSKDQVFLFKMIQLLFPGLLVEVNYRHPDLLFQSNRKMELDVFIPSLQLAFEFHGKSIIVVLTWQQETNITSNTICGDLRNRFERNVRERHATNSEFL
jgi:hypothetical protein